MGTLYRKVIKDMREMLVVASQRGLLLDTEIPSSKDAHATISCSREFYTFQGENYLQAYLNAVEKREFVCILNDGSILQASYKFTANKENLLEGSLTFLPNPGLTIVPEFSASATDEPIESSQKAASKYVRIDFNKENSYKEITHPCCHIHIGLESTFRIALNKFPFFSEFLKFILFINNYADWLQITPTTSEPNNQEPTLNMEAYLNHRLKNHSERFIQSELSKTEKAHYVLLLEGINN